jgi:hypothetical protein
VAPATAVEVKFNALPLHTGPLLPAVAAAGAPGSDNVLLMVFELQPLAVTFIFVYAPSLNPPIVNWPLPLLVWVIVAWFTAFLS